MQSSKEQQREIRKPSSAINAKNRGKQQNGKDQRSLPENQRSKGTFHAKTGSIKDRNGMDLTEAEDIKKRWQEYTEELYKKKRKKLALEKNKVLILMILVSILRNRRAKSNKI